MKILNFVLVFTMGIIIAVEVSAECNEIGLRNCGRTGDVSWKVSSDGKTLTIFGSGNMGSYGTYGAPWYENVDTIQKVVVENGVSTIGVNAFDFLSNVTQISIGNTVTELKENCCSHMPSLTSLIIPDSVSDIKRAAFIRANGLQELVIPTTVVNIEDYAFAYSEALKSIVIEDGTQSIKENAFLGVYATNLQISAVNLEKYLTANGGLEQNALVMCTYGNCFDTLQTYDRANNTDYANRVSIGIKNYDGSFSIYENGKFARFKNKRIYTIEEANRVAGEKNRVSIKYR